ncbi:phage tail tape measure protein [bacterium]|nr:phage tail tape measure protein [bacterium]
MALKVGELFAVLRLDKGSFDKDMNGVESRFGQSEKTINNLKNKTLIGLGVGLATLGGAAFKFSNDFNESMANVASLIPGNISRVNELKGSVQSMAIETGKSTQDIAGGLYQVISAFGDTSDTAKILEANVKAATAGVASTTDSINLTSAVTKAYGDTSAKAVQHVADLAMETVKLGQTTFPELASSIGRVTPLAKSLGVTQEELFAVMATATGVTGNAAEVSTQYKGILQGLLAPTQAMSDLIEKQGFASGEAMVKQLGLQKTIEAIVKAAQDSGQPLQNYIGSIEGQTLAMSLAGPQADKLTAALKANGDVNTAVSAAYKEQTQGINKMGFAWARAQQLGAVFLQKIGNISPLIMATGSMLTMITTLKDLGVAFNIVKIKAAAAWIATLGPIALVIAAIAAVAAGVYLVIKHWDKIKAFFKKLWAGVKVAFAWGWNLVKQACLNATPAGFIFKHWDKIKAFFKNLWSAVWKITMAGVTKIVDYIKEKLQKVAGFFKNLFDAVVGHSYIPDLVSGVQKEMTKLGGVAMVEPVQRATQRVDQSFERVNENRAAETKSVAGNSSANTAALLQMIRIQNSQLRELRKMNAVGVMP